MHPERTDVTLFTEKFRYVCGPFIVRAANGDILVSWNMSLRREVGTYAGHRFLHPPMDPDYRNYVIRSSDNGKTWDLPMVVPSYDWAGGEHVAFCVLDNGEILASIYLRKFFPLAEAEKNQSHRYGWYHQPAYPWVVTHGGTYVFRSRDHGETWGEGVQIDSAPFISAYSPRNIVQLDTDTLIFTAGAAAPMYVGMAGWTEPPNQVKNGLGNRLVDGKIVEEPSRVFVCISRDGGRTWNETREIAAHRSYYFAEPAMIRLSSGRLLCHMRNCRQTGHLWQVVSDDGGESWSEPEMTPMWGYPAHMVQLSDGRLLSVYGHRRKPFGIRACVSTDDGDSWNYENEVIIRDDLPNGAIGYPVSMVNGDDSVSTVYWTENKDGQTGVEMSTYSA